MADPFHTIGAAGMALVVTGGICWFLAVAIRFPRMHDSSEARMRFLMAVLVALILSVTGFICIGGWALHQSQAPLWANVLGGISGAALMLFIYLLNHRIRSVDRQRGVGLLADRSLNGTMIDLISSTPGAALFWITLSY